MFGGNHGSCEKQHQKEKQGRSSDGGGFGKLQKRVDFFESCGKLIVMKPDYRVIIDQIGRVVLGVCSSETETSLSLYNPIILHFQPSMNGQLELQVFPLFFFELLDKEKRSQNTWTYSKNTITQSDVELNADILLRYSQINTPPAPVQNNPKVISIDDLD